MLTTLRTSGWDHAIDVLAAEWAAIVGRPASDREEYEAQFAAMAAEHAALRAAGRWVSGPSDLLAIIGKAHDELVHSRVLAWLMTPTGRHALGDRFLRALLDAAWPDDEVLLDGRVAVDLEVERSDIDEVRGDLAAARADIVVRLPDSTLVIENKIWAGEQPAQCERLYWAFANEGGVVRYLFLTPSGRPPTSANSTDARAAWRTLTYATVLEILDRVIADDGPDDQVSSAARQYALTLRSWGVR